MSIHKWRRLNSQTVFEHPRMTLVEDEVELPTGKTTHYLRQPYNGNGGVIVLCRCGESILIQREYSYPVDDILYQFPGGRIEDGETPEQAAKRELAEESGLTIENLQYLGWFYADNRRTDAKLHVVCGDYLGQSATSRPDEEEFIESEWITAKDFKAKLVKGEIKNYAMLAAWTLFENKQNHSQPTNSSLIILRGNSGSGKTTTAKLLQQELGCGTMLVSQDAVRREMLRVRDEADNPAIQLIYDLCMYGNRIGYTVILEGILSNKKYGKMLQRLLADFNGTKYIYYFDLPIEETLRRHANKPNAAEFGETEMRKWWKDKDFLGVSQEKTIKQEMSQTEVIQMIMSDMAQ